MTRFEKKNLLRVKLESIFRRMRNGEPLDEDERYLYFNIDGFGGTQTDEEAIEEYLYSLSVLESEVVA